jgi:hypothetical protein
MLSRDGDASATHKSCCGLVYTPILAFEGFSTATRGSSVAEGAMIANGLFFYLFASRRDKLTVPEPACSYAVILSTTFRLWGCECGVQP